MKRHRKSRKRSSNDLNEEVPQNIAKHELVVHLDEISATQKYVPVFGKILQPKQKAAKTDCIEETGLCDQPAKRIMDDLEVDVHKIDSVETNTKANGGQIENVHSSSNGEEELDQDSHIIAIERKECPYEEWEAQTNEKCSKAEIDGNGTGIQIQNECRKNESEVLNSADKVHMQEDLALSEKVPTMQEKMPNNTECEDHFKAHNSKDDAIHDTERTIKSTVQTATFNRDSLNDSKESSSARKSSENDCSRVQGAEILDHDVNQGTRLTGTSPSNEGTLHRWVEEGGGANAIDQEQVCFAEDVARRALGSKYDNSNINKVNGLKVINSSAAKGESMTLALAESRDEIKDSEDQRKDSNDNERRVKGQQYNESEQYRLVGNEELRDESILKNLSPKPTNPKTNSLDTDWERIIDVNTSVPKISMALLSQKEEGIVKDSLSQRTICKNEITNTTNIEPSLEYEEDAMMTDSQINLLDEDMLTLPQSSVQEYSIPDTNETKYGQNRRTIGDYIADGEHLMKGIIEEISGITKSIVTMKRFIDSIKKQKQTRINTIWKSSKTK